MMCCPPNGIPGWDVFASGSVGLWLWAESESAALPPVESAKALAAIAGILILGLGAVLVIGLAGRWIRRWLFPKSDSTAENQASPESRIGRVDWAKPQKKIQAGSPEAFDEPE